MEPEYVDKDATNLVLVLSKVFSATQKQFVFIIDEWDCVFRENKNNVKLQTSYLEFLRGLLKGPAYVKLVYMTGIVPIKKCVSHSVLNMFDEYTMTNPGILAEYVGSTEEVRCLCEKYEMDFDNYWTQTETYEALKIYIDMNKKQNSIPAV